jgi:hypothetical protein
MPRQHFHCLKPNLVEKIFKNSGCALKPLHYKEKLVNSTKGNNIVLFGESYIKNADLITVKADGAL